MNFSKGLRYYGLTICWSIVILILCFMPMGHGNGPGSFFFGFDKLVHLVMFYVFTILVLTAKKQMLNSYHIGIPAIMGIILINALFGGLVEILQWKVFTSRSAEWWDFICDMFGACMAIFGYCTFTFRPLK